MSAFMVEDKTINNVVSHIYMKVLGNRDLGYQYKHLLSKKYNLDSDIAYNQLADDMFKLNIESIEQRYGKGEAEKFRPLDFQYKFNCHANVRAYILKSLQCWLYQCCEGDIPETSELYNTMKEVSHCIAHSIVEDTEEYQKAPWG